MPECDDVGEFLGWENSDKNEWAQGRREVDWICTGFGERAQLRVDKEGMNKERNRKQGKKGN